MQIEIQQTETELLLFIPATQKERAKAIEGRRWDPERKCWAYPKTVRVYDALVAEFGDDLVSLDVPRPAKAIPAGAPTPTGSTPETRDLQKEICRIRKSLEAMSRANGDGSDPQTNALKRLVATHESEMAAVRRRLQEREVELEAARQKQASLQTELDRLRNLNANMQAEMKRAQSPDGSAAEKRDRWLKETAKSAAGKEEGFARLVAGLKLNESLPIELVKHLEHELRRRLKLKNNELSVHDLITQARDAEVLTSEGIDLAHLIRKQRNVMAHDRVDHRTYSARVLLCLFAASLLWPELGD